MRKKANIQDDFKLKSTKKNKVDKAWVSRHLNDGYVHKAHNDGYRSRAAYKLLEIDESYGLLKSSKIIVDLGSAPGSWSQIVAAKITEKEFLVSVDLLAMAPIRGANFIQGDFTESKVLYELVGLLDGRDVDLVLSDMSPNLSGIKMVDQSRGGYLVELVLDFATEYLKVGGACVIKVFIGGEFDRLVKLAREIFEQVVIEKPSSSRSKSSETYMICRNKI
jgi:23S rRNA (uridine2552-2'-O)-methyltransferase